MGRRRWRFVIIATILLFVIKDSQCQDDDFYYSPLAERNFAQVQPPLYSNNRQQSFFDNGDSYRLQQKTLPAQQYNEGNVRFPSPNYNQNPSPFQLPSGRSQAGTQYYVNQPEFPSQRQRYRPALPFNYQLVHPASTKRPDVSQIHSVAYQNDPSKPETFLGQITLNNPDIDYLQNSRFKNLPFDSNSLKSNGQTGHITHHEDTVNSDTQDVYDEHRVTTYNPNKFSNKQRLNIQTNGARFSHFSSPLDEKTDFREPPKLYIKNKSREPKPSSSLLSSTEYKPLLDIEPLLEEDISDLSSFRELMKNKQGSNDVQIIKSNKTFDTDSTDDSKPDASSMNTDNYLREIPVEIGRRIPTTTTTTTSTTPKHDDTEIDDVDIEGEYVEYYEDEIEETTKHAEPVSKAHEDIYDEYDSAEETDKGTTDPSTSDASKTSGSSHSHVSSTTESFDILVMKTENQSKTVQDDNFKQFVDTTVIDQNDNDTKSLAALESTESVPEDEEDSTSIETPSILGQEIVSVVTTKSVVNGTISVPDVTFAPSTTKLSSESESLSSQSDEKMNDSSIPMTTENWIVVASVQTSRSVSGARFLPFPTVEQEEKKQVLTDEEEGELVTENPGQDHSENKSHDSSDEDEDEHKHVKALEMNSSTSSTENINDKLDTIQSELSSAVLSGSIDKENKNIELLTESTTEQTTTTSTPSTTTTTSTTPLPNVFTLKSTLPPTFTERSSPDPLPVQIKKFAPRVTSSTTPKPKKKLVTIMDDLSGFLPPGYKSRHSYKDKRTSTTTSTTTTTTPSVPTINGEIPIINENQGRSSGISSKNKVIILDDKSLLPREYRPKEHKQHDDGLRKIQKDDLSKLLPPGYKPPAEDETPKPSIFDKIKIADISDLLPKGYNPTNNSATEKPKLPINAVPVDITALLPPGFKLNNTEEKQDGNDSPLTKFKVADISSLLPPDFNLNQTETTEAPIPSTTKASGGIKLVFPSRPGGKANRKTTTPKALTPAPVTPKIQKGWPTRPSTEFTGWPSPSTTPFSIEKLLEAQRNATATSPIPEVITEASTRRTTTTTTTTPAPPPSTTPGVCRKECDIAATIKIVSGVQWVPELLDRHTDEWQRLAHDVKEELNSVYSKSDKLKKWFKGIRIDGFSKGSVLVDYFIELNEVEDKIDTLDLKKMFHQSLHEAPPGSVTEVVVEEPKDDAFDPDVMLGDQPDVDRMRKSDEKMTKTIDKSAGKLEIGKFVMDPAYTEFIVLPKREEPKQIETEEESFLPQWGIAVIVIALASLLFVVIFGVTVLVNRQKSAKAKQPIPLSEEMLRDLDKSHMGGFDDLHHMKERDLPYLPPGKRMSTAFIEQLAYPNPGDSWRSEWTPQLQKYMQHYTPDSGRGSQIYGPAYGHGGGSQLYGQTGGGSQVYGYTGEYPRSHFSRRRSEYDSNF